VPCRWSHECRSAFSPIVLRLVSSRLVSVSSCLAQHCLVSFKWLTQSHLTSTHTTHMHMHTLSLSLRPSPSRLRFPSDSPATLRSQTIPRTHTGSITRNSGRIHFNDHSSMLHAFRLSALHHQSPSPRTLSLSPPYCRFSHRRAHHIMKNATIGKDVVTAAVHESTSARRWVISLTRRLTLGSSGPTHHRCSANLHRDQKGHLPSREVPTTQRMKDKSEGNWDEARSRTRCV